MVSGLVLNVLAGTSALADEEWEMNTRRDQLEALWKEKDVVDGRVVDAMVIIFRTRGCRWSREMGCLMCGYNISSDPEVSLPDLEAQLGSALEEYQSEPLIKIYTSGSFLDEDEIPIEFRNEVLQSFDGGKRILVESRPEFISGDVLSDMDTSRCQIAIGLESADDNILEHCIRKGFTASDYVRAASLLNDFDVPLRTYLLLKPPFITERMAFEDTVSSVSFASEYSESISINPVNVQKYTLVERLWKRGDYRPPWIWTLIEVLKRKGDSSVRVFSAPSGGGTDRGVHNCGECDGELLEALQQFSFTQNINELEGYGCACRDEWRSLMEVQDYLSTSVDVEKYLDSIPRLDG